MICNKCDGRGFYRKDNQLYACSCNDGLKFALEFPNEHEEELKNHFFPEQSETIVKKSIKCPICYDRGLYTKNQITYACTCTLGHIYVNKFPPGSKVPVENIDEFVKNTSVQLQSHADISKEFFTRDRFLETFASMASKLQYKDIAKFLDQYPNEFAKLKEMLSARVHNKHGQK